MRAALAAVLLVACSQPAPAPPVQPKPVAEVPADAPAASQEETLAAIQKAMNELDGFALWDETDGFYYDVLHMPGDARQLKVRSMVGLIPLFAVETLEPEIVDRLPGFRRRLQWFVDNRPEFRDHVTTAVGAGGVRRLLSLVRRLLRCSWRWLM